MTPEEKADALTKLLSQQHALRTVVEAANLQAELAVQAEAHGFAFAIYMLCEALQVYAKELSDFVVTYLSDDEEDE
jgi:hypothetical protein